MKKFLIALALFFIPAAASAQCNGVFPTGTICGNATGSSNTPRPTIATSFALGLTVGSTPITSGTTTAPLFNNAGILGNGLIASTWSTYTGFEATTARTVQDKLQDWFSVLDYAGASGCVADATSDCSTAFNAAIQAAADYSALNNQITPTGTVYVPAGAQCYRIHSATLNLLKGISLIGSGYGSCILADDVDAITLNFVAGFGNQQIANLTIIGENSTAARTAIKRPGSTTEAFTQLGLNIHDISLLNFDTAINILTAQNIWIQRFWALNVNQCISLNGFVAVVDMEGVLCTRGSGGGTGATSNDGLAFNSFNYTTGSGILSPESIKIIHPQIYGFNTAIDAASAVYVAISNADISALVDGIKFTNVTGGMFINNSYVALTSTAGAHAIYGVGTAGSSSRKTNIYSNYMIASGTTSAVAVQINDIGTSAQTNISIRSNLFHGFNTRDVLIYNPTNTIIDNNVSESTGVTDSINVGAAVAGEVVISNNVTTAAIVANASDITAGAARLFGNVVVGSRQAATWNVETNSVTAGQLMVGGGGGVQPTGISPGTGVATALATNVGTAGAFVVNGGALGTPTSGVGTNLTGTASGLTAGHVTTNANLTGPITSSGNATSIAAQTGTGSTFAMSAGPTFTGTVQVTSILLAGVDGSRFTLGPGGTGALNGQLFINGSNATGQGADIIFAKNSSSGSNSWFLGHVSAIEGTGTSTDLEYFNQATSGRTMRLSSADDSVAFASIINATSGTVGAINTLGGIGVSKDIWGNGQEFLPSITTSSAAQTGTVCWTTGTGKFTVDTTVGCLTSLLSAKNITEKLSSTKALAIIDKLDPFAFRYKDGWGDSGHYEQFGLGAEEVAAVDERLVGRDPEGNLQGVRYQEMTAVLAGAIQQLKVDNDNLRACNATWKCRIFGWK